MSDLLYCRGRRGTQREENKTQTLRSLRSSDEWRREELLIHVEASAKSIGVEGSGFGIRDPGSGKGKRRADAARTSNPCGGMRYRGENATNVLCGGDWGTGTVLPAGVQGAE